MISTCCGQRLKRLTRDGDQDRLKVAVWQCLKCGRRLEQRLRVSAYIKHQRSKGAKP